MTLNRPGNWELSGGKSEGSLVEAANGVKFRREGNYLLERRNCGAEKSVRAPKISGDSVVNRAE